MTNDLIKQFPSSNDVFAFLIELQENDDSANQQIKLLKKFPVLGIKRAKHLCDLYCFTNDCPTLGCHEAEKPNCKRCVEWKEIQDRLEHLLVSVE